MLSRSRGQILRVAAVMHILFHMDTPTSILNEINEIAVRAADCFVDLCMQQAAYLGVGGIYKRQLLKSNKVGPAFVAHKLYMYIYYKQDN